MNRTPPLSEAAQIQAWRREIAHEVADQLRPEFEKQTALLEKMLETQMSGTEANLALIAACKRRFGI